MQGQPKKQCICHIVSLFYFLRNLIWYFGPLYIRLGAFPSAYESRGGLTDSGLLLPDSLVFTHESEEDDIIGGDPKPDSGSDHSLYCVLLLSNWTKGNQNF